MLVGALSGAADATSGGMTGMAFRVHADAGSLGWLVLGVLAMASAMFASVGPGRSAGDRTDRSLAWLAVMTVFVVIAANAGSSAFAAAAADTALLVEVAAIAVWLGIVQARTRIAWTVPRLGVVAALAVLLTGSVLGTVAAWLTFNGDAASAAGPASAHSVVLAVPFVMLAATAAAECAAGQQAVAAEQVTTSGLVQVGALTLAAAALIAGVLTSSLALTEANIPLEIGGIGIFLVRVGPRLLTAGRARGSGIWLVTSAVAMAVDVGLFAHVVYEVGAQRYASLGLVPAWLVFTVDHLTFAGIGGAALYGASAALTGQRDRWPAADIVAVAGLVLGIAGYAVGLGIRSPVEEAASGGAFGLSVLLAVVVTGLRVAVAREPARSPADDGTPMRVP